MEDKRRILEKEFQFYIDNQDDLVRKYENKYIVIKNGEVLNAYDSFDAAIIDTKKAHQLGTFLVQKCEANKESYTQTYHSRVSFIQ